MIARQPGSRNAKVPMPEPAEKQAGTMRPRSKQGSMRPLLREGFVVSGVFRALQGQILSPERSAAVAKKKGNSEGSITRHKKSGLYMARYTVETASSAKRRTPCMPRTARRPQRSLRMP